MDKGTIRYPYSTRELVNVVRHINAFPQDGMANILKNVFDFDQYSADEPVHGEFCGGNKLLIHCVGSPAQQLCG